MHQWPAWIIPALSSMLMDISPPLPAAFSRFSTLIGLLGVGYLLIFLGTATALLVHPILAVILALPMPLALLLAQFFRRQGVCFPLARLSGVALCLAIAALPALPYLLPGMESAGSGGVTARVESGITLALVWLYFPLGLVALPAAIRAFRERDRQNVFIVLLALTTALFLLTQRVKCDWYHLYLMSIPLGEALELTTRLLAPGSDISGALDTLAALPEPVYLFLYWGDMRKSLPLLAAEYDALPGHVRLELDLPAVKIYRVLPLN